MQRTAIVNLKHRPDLQRALAKRDECEGVVRIDRRTRFGNPYRIGRDGTREEVIALYRAELWRRIRAGEGQPGGAGKPPRQDPRLPLRAAALPRRGARPRRGLGRTAPRRLRRSERRAAKGRAAARGARAPAPPPEHLRPHPRPGAPAMPIVYRGADLFASGCEALVNPVNCAGAMGRGLALAFKRRYPAHFDSYRRACRAGRLRPGTVHVDDLGAGARPRFLVALPTKRHWRDPRAPRRRRALRARPRRDAHRTPHRLGRRHRLPHRPPRPRAARAGPGANGAAE